MKVRVPTTVSAVAQAITAGFKLLADWQKTRHVRRLRAAVEASGNYIQVNKLEGEFNNISLKEQNKLLKKFEKRFEHYKQG